MLLAVAIIHIDENSNVSPAEPSSESTGQYELARSVDLLDPGTEYLAVRFGQVAPMYGRLFRVIDSKSVKFCGNEIFVAPRWSYNLREPSPEIICPNFGIQEINGGNSFMYVANLSYKNLGPVRNLFIVKIGDTSRLNVRFTDNCEYLELTRDILLTIHRSISECNTEVYGFEGVVRIAGYKPNSYDGEVQVLNLLNCEGSVPCITVLMPGGDQVSYHRVNGKFEMTPVPVHFLQKLHDYLRNSTVHGCEYSGSPIQVRYNEYQTELDVYGQIDQCAFNFIDCNHPCLQDILR